MGVEPEQSHPTGGGRLTDQRTDDEVPGDDEEDVHADEAARDQVRPEVVGEHQEDGDGSQTLDVEPSTGGARPVGPARPAAHVRATVRLERHRQSDPDSEGSIS